jgi:hypothetical protein
MEVLDILIRRANCLKEGDILFVSQEERTAFDLLLRECTPKRELLLCGIDNNGDEWFRGFKIKVK